MLGKAETNWRNLHYERKASIGHSITCFLLVFGLITVYSLLLDAALDAWKELVVRD